MPEDPLDRVQPSVEVNGVHYPYRHIAGMLHVSGCEVALGNIGDPSTPIGPAQKTIAEMVHALRPGCKTVFLSLGHQVHDTVAQASAESVDGLFSAISSDAIIVPRQDEVAIAVFVGDCLPVNVVGQNYRALIHFGWQEACDGVAVNFHREWMDLSEYVGDHNVYAGQGIGMPDLPLTGQAVPRLLKAGLAPALFKGNGEWLSWWEAARQGKFQHLAGREDWWNDIVVNLSLPAALELHLNPDPEPLPFDHQFFYEAVHATPGSTYWNPGHASARRAKDRGDGTFSWRDAYIVMPAA